MLTFEVKLSRDSIGLLKRLHDYDKIADKHLIKAMRKSVASIESSAKRAAPVGVSSKLRNSIASEVRPKGNEIIGRVGSTMKKEAYPMVMERGRRPWGKAPPPGALDRWVRIKLGVPKRRVKSVAFLIGRKIAQRGITGRFFLRKAYFKNKPKVERFHKEALNNIIKELAHG